MRAGFGELGAGGVAIGGFDENLDHVSFGGDVTVGILHIEIDVVAGFDFVAVAVLHAGVTVFGGATGGDGFGFGVVLFLNLSGGDEELGVGGDLDVGGQRRDVGELLLKLLWVVVGNDVFAVDLEFAVASFDVTEFGE